MTTARRVQRLFKNVDGYRHLEAAVESVSLLRYGLDPDGGEALFGIYHPPNVDGNDIAVTSLGIRAQADSWSLIPYASIRSVDRDRTVAKQDVAKLSIVLDSGATCSVMIPGRSTVVINNGREIGGKDVWLFLRFLMRMTQVK